MKIGRVTLVDPTTRADIWGEENEKVIARIFEAPCKFVTIPASNSDEARAALLRLCDVEHCPFVVTTGGIGPAAADVLPEVTLAVIEKELPGFGEIMRQFSFEKTPYAILSRAVAGIRGRSVILNLPSKPNPIKACMKLLREALAECIGQVSGERPLLFVDPIVVPIEKWLPFLKKFRPKGPDINERP